MLALASKVIPNNKGVLFITVVFTLEMLVVATCAYEREETNAKNAVHIFFMLLLSVFLSADAALFHWV